MREETRILLNPKTYTEEESFPSVSIIVLNYNNLADLPVCLNSLLDLNYPTNRLEIILADNSSSDNSVEFVETNYPNIKIVRFPYNYGYAKGNNLAVEHARGDYVAFVNPDTRVDKNWLIELVCVLDSDDTIAACGGKVYFWDDNKKVQVAGSKMCLHGGGFNIGYGDEDLIKYNKEKYTLSPPGCAMVVKGSTFKKLGGFDSDYFMYVEELDFGYRLWLAGYKAYYNPNAIAYHKMPHGHKFKINKLMIFNEEKNRLITIVKNFETRNVFKGIAICISYALYKIVIYFINGKFDLISSLIIAYISFLNSITTSLRKRKYIQKSRLISDNDMRHLGLLATFKESLRELRRTTKYR